MHATTTTGLVRGIRRWDLVALFINSIIGAGIFGLPSRVYALVGTWSLLAYVICALLVLAIVLCFAEVGSRFRDTGGPYLYSHVAFGPVVGFEIGWLVWLARLTAFAALSNLFVDYLGHFSPIFATRSWRAGVIVAIVAALTAVNVAGVRNAALIGNGFTIGKLIPLLLFVAAGLFVLEPVSFTLPAAPDYASFSTAVLLLAFAFTGFESAVIPAGEIHEPRRNIPFAVLVALAVVAPLYFLIQVVCIGTLPELAASTRPLADASARFLGATGAAVITVGALVSILGTLNGIMLAAPRVLYGMAEQGQLPRALAATSERFRTPHVSILVSAAVMLALTLSGSFITALTISTLARLITYAATCAAVPVLRRRADTENALFRAPGGTITAVVALALIGWLLSNGTLREALQVAMAAAIGLAIYLGYRFSVRAGRRRVQ